MRQVYIAQDGKQFDSYSECQDYEIEQELKNLTLVTLDKNGNECNLLDPTVTTEFISIQSEKDIEFLEKVMNNYSLFARALEPNNNSSCVSSLYFENRFPLKIGNFCLKKDEFKNGLWIEVDKQIKKLKQQQESLIKRKKYVETRKIIDNTDKKYSVLDKLINKFNKKKEKY